MVRQLYCVFDVVAVESASPFMAKSDSVALRMFENDFKQNPGMSVEHFKLMWIGEFDTETSLIKVMGVPREVKFVMEDEE